ncbi:MAG TPA: flagellar hook-basal body complex protein FliE [Candidatus Hydrogenedentes bacterium]|jgi:flagellar hook-basal body complex protein FliE|nr:flagellar hook-basal body complex protein FliE [Candidatus Hydrogenedentota bacterium]HOC31430.1 flagellar hook-basal body complex protein FliE [Armatimonadota bacterium]HNZ18002.1 flagellar hook-basal body complex protein FliE [Candidatus Hydrogenedentota bacterium]HOH33085.1 flagellar hook-basal body complex protein FliE [Candidatus Hydrogenedentota bacterium]HPA05871.1 flagellar hook-basal body complex protein FliE [Candidatus Hydrogenedentota bacterium]
MADESMRVEGLGPKRAGLTPNELRTSRIASDTTSAGSFKDVLAEAVGEVQRLQNEADMTIKQVVSGEIRDVTDAIVALEKADVAFQTMMTVRNKIVAAYEEIMRTQI